MAARKAKKAPDTWWWPGDKGLETQVAVFICFIFNWIHRKIDTDFISKSILSIHTNAFFAAGLFITNPFLWDDPKWLWTTVTKVWKTKTFLLCWPFSFFLWTHCLPRGFSRVAATGDGLFLFTTQHEVTSEEDERVRGRRQRTRRAGS